MVSLERVVSGKFAQGRSLKITRGLVEGFQNWNFRRGGVKGYKTNNKKSFVGWEEQMFSGTTKPKMNYTPKEYFYSLSSNQKLHDQETTRVQFVIMFRIN